MYNSILMSLDMEGLNIIYDCGERLLLSSLRFLEAGGLSLESSWVLATVVVVRLSAELFQCVDKEEDGALSICTYTLISHT